MEPVHEIISNAVSGLSLQSAVLGVGGSPRKGGNSDVLLEHILTGIQEYKISTHRIQLRDLQFRPCLGCEKCRQDKICTGLADGMSLVYPFVYRSLGLVLVSPTHNYNITAWMKAFIDRLYCFYDFQDTRPRAWSSRLAGMGRKAVLAAVAEQEDDFDMGFTLEAMRRPLESLGYEIRGELPVYGIFDRGGVKKKKEVLLAAKNMGADLARALSL